MLEPLIPGRYPLIPDPSLPLAPSERGERRAVWTGCDTQGYFSFRPHHIPERRPGTGGCQSGASRTAELIAVSASGRLSRIN
jgi:hypothetical protein